MNNQAPLKYSKGLTMIEVLVTLIILSVGLLGMAAMQLTGIRSANGSSYRTQASIVANDMVERMRANPAAIDDDLFLLIESSTDIDCDTVPNPYCGEYFNGTNNVAAANCTTTQLATYDINVWFCGEVNSGARVASVEAVLPQASATIVCNDSDAGDGDACSFSSTHTVTLRWEEPNPQRNGPATVTQNVSITFLP